MSRRALSSCLLAFVFGLAATGLRCGADRGPAGHPRFSWPPFPFSLTSRAARVLAVVYSTDNIGPKSTLASLGYPGRGIFRFHRDHPRIKVVLMSCPANRYSGEGTLADSPAATSTWRTLALDDRFDWIELGNEGYTHSPPGDTNLDHHEFAVMQTGCNVDHSKLAEPAYCRRRMDLIRRAYSTAGIPNDTVVLLRFPGLAYGPQALEAAVEAGFVAILGGRNLREADRPWWVADTKGEEILEIQDTRFLRLFARWAELEEGLSQGRITRTGVVASPAFLAAVQRGRQYIDRVAAGGGILNLSDRWTQTFKTIGGAHPRYLVLDAVLTDMEERYGPRVWYPRGRELALWLNARHNARVTWNRAEGGVRVDVNVPDRWVASGLRLEEASLVVALPQGWSRIGNVRLRANDEGWNDLDPSRFWLQGNRLAIVFPLRGHTQIQIAGEPS
ncbi:MAG: hypothetical protein ACE5HU_00340 [Acidobacteriota bacterium]